MNNKQALFFIWATILNQSQKAEIVLENTKILMERLGLIKNFEESYKNISYSKIENAILEKPVLHRFPKNMSTYLYSSIFNINNKYKEAMNVFSGNFEEIEKNLSTFLGIGKHKTEVAIIILKEYMRNKKSISKEIFETNCITLQQTIFREFEILEELGE